MRYLLLALTIATISCSKPKQDFSSIQNQLKLNDQRNAVIIHTIEDIVKETGSRKEDLQFLNTVETVTELKNSLNINYTHPEIDTLNSYSSLATFLDSLKIRFQTQEYYQQFTNEFETALKHLDNYKDTRTKDDNYYHLLIQVSYLETLILEKYVSYSTLSGFIFIADYHLHLSETLSINKENKLIITLYPTRIYSNSKWNFDNFKLTSKNGISVQTILEKIDGALLVSFTINEPDTLQLTGTISLNDSITDLNWDISVLVWCHLYHFVCWV